MITKIKKYNLAFNCMKRILWGLAAFPLLAMLATSCKQEIVESKKDKDNQIILNAAIGKQTRASEFYYWASGAGFKAVAYKSGTTTVYSPFTLSWGGGGTSNWSYSEGSGSIPQPAFNLTYFALHPADFSALTGTDVTVTSGGGATTATLNYTVAAPAGGPDLIATCVNNSSNPLVTLTFDHILSQINFAVQGMTGKVVKITGGGIAIGSVKNTGLYTFGGSWASQAGAVAYNYVPASAAANFPVANNVNTIVYFGNTGDIALGANNSNDNALMLLPQEFDTPGSGGSFTFNYEITDLVPNVLASGTATAYFGDFTVREWLPGKRYLYLIDFEHALNQPIRFTVIVNDWDDATNGDTAQPLLVAATSQTAIENAITAHNTLKGANAGLTVFPITLPTIPAATITLETFDDSNFAMGDKIMINCGSPAGAAFIALHASLTTDWSIAVSGNDAVLTKLL